MCVVFACGLLFGLGASGPASAQSFDCGNAYYDDGVPVDSFWFGGGFGGDEDHMAAVFFDLDDFGYAPGEVEIYGFCSGNVMGWGGVWPNRVYVYPDAGGVPDDSVVLAEGTIHTGNAQGQAVVMFDEPVILHGDFWLVNRGYSPYAGTDFNQDCDADGDAAHSYVSETGVGGLSLFTNADFCLRAYLRPVERNYLAAGMARAPGAGTSQWRSKMAILNTSSMAADVDVTFVQGGGSQTVNITIPAGQMAAWDDVVEEAFGITDPVSGSIRVDSNTPVVVTARTFNQAAQGTFGQFLPGARMGDSMGSGETGVLSQLTNNAAFRTNVGFINLGDSQVQVRVTVYDASGAMLGTRNVAVAPSGWKQQNDIFGAVGAGTVDNGYAMVEVLTEGGMVWGYGSVVDNATGDPTTVPLVIQ
jgi:hypothetical protein